jgi:localization factor PodJL
MAEHVASNEAVTQLANEVVMLGEKIDYIASATGGSDALSNLDQRVAAIADALGERAQSGGGVPPRLESLVQSLGEKIEQIHSSRGETGAVGHLEQRIAGLVEKLDASQSRLSQLETIERGLGDLLAHMKEMRANKTADPAQADHAPAVTELKHNMDRTQDALEAVHGTLGHVVDRLAMIEKEFRNNARRQVDDESGDVEPTPAMGKLAVRAVSLAEAAPAPPLMPVPAPPLSPERAEPEPSPARPQAEPRRRVATSLPIHPDSSGDQPIEPGSGPPRFTARIAASEAALAGAVPGEPAPAGKSNFIAAARRAAQAAMQQGARPPNPRGEPVVAEQEEGRPSLRARIMKRMKAVFIAASIIAVVVGGFQIAGNWLNLDEVATSETEKASKAEPSKTEDSLPIPDGFSSGPANPQQPGPALPHANPIEIPPLTGLSSPATTAPSLLSTPALVAPPAPAVAPKSPPSQTKNDITGAVPDAASAQSEPAAEPALADKERLPIAVGSTRLRNAALAGDPGAAYEVALRFAEGRGIPISMPDAAYWFARAASRGLVPAQFRYASMLEKGQGVKKDPAQARELYLAAAAKGNAKAMHNLAVLYAEGLDGKPDYAAAVKWFRTAATHGIADSQYNLGVLTARGLGAEKDFVESYKWFALAAAQGDLESAKKRDEVARHLGTAALASAQQAAESFTIEPQPKMATTIPKPQGGWDNAAVPPTSKSKTSAQAPNAPTPLASPTPAKR